MSLAPLALSAVSLAASVSPSAPMPAVPEPTLKPGLDKQDISPGIEGFLFTALMVVMAIIVFRLMVRSVRRVQQRSPEAEAMLVDRHQQHVPEEIREGGERLDGDAHDRIERLRRRYPGYLQDPTPEPESPDTGREPR
ncbi:hypothetical protein [Micrococcus porci]|uniref:hypothetical protein n=1 Tax=Micrococcus porci TaxID=2856555 RepID=UPI003CEB318E